MFIEKHYFGSSFQEAQDRSIAPVFIKSHCNQCSTQTEHGCPEQFGVRKRSKEKILLPDGQEKLSKNRKLYKRKMSVVPNFS